MKSPGLRSAARAGVFLIFGFSASMAGEVAISSPPLRAVRAGDVVAVAWRGLPEEVEELELLLSVEGRDLPLRLTPQISPYAGYLLWRVPNLPSDEARIRIRFGLDGEEREGAPSLSFRILGAADEPPAVLVFRDGEWWSDSGSSGGLPGGLAPPQEGRLQENRESPACADSPDHPAAGEEVRVRGRLFGLARSGSSPSLPALSRRPLEVPARR